MLWVIKSEFFWVGNISGIITYFEIESWSTLFSFVFGPSSYAFSMFNRNIANFVRFKNYWNFFQINLLFTTELCYKYLSNLGFRHFTVLFGSRYFRFVDVFGFLLTQIRDSCKSFKGLIFLTLIDIEGDTRGELWIANFGFAGHFPRAWWLRSWRHIRWLHWLVRNELLVN